MGRVCIEKRVVKDNNRILLLLKLSPLMIPFILLFSIGTGFALVQSLGFISTLPTTEQGVAGYIRLFTDPWFGKSFLYSLFIAFSSALISILAGTFLAYHIWKLPYFLKPFSLVYTIPLILPHISIAFIILILAGRTGFFSSLFYHAGVIKDYNEFPSLLFNGSGIGIIIAYVYKETPFVILMLLAIFKKINPHMLQTARMLGARRITIFGRIILPFLLPAINSTFIILFLYSFGAFDIPFILSESNPEMLSVTVFNLYFRRDFSNRPYAMVILMVMFLFTCIFVFLYIRLITKLQSPERRL